MVDHETENEINNFARILSGAELYERYHDKLPVFFIEDIFDGYVNFNQEGNKKENNL